MRVRLIPMGWQRVRKRWDTIGGHLIGLFVIQVVLLAGTIYFGAREDFQKAEINARSQATTMAGLAAQEIGDAIGEDRATLDQIPGFAELFATGAVCQFTGADAQEDWSDEALLRSTFQLVRTDGSPACPDAGVDPSIANERWFKQAASTSEPVESGPSENTQTGKQELIFATRVPTVGSVVVIRVDLSSAGDMLENLFGKSSPKPAFVVTSADRSTELGSTGGTSGRDLTSTSFSAPVASDSYSFEDLGGTERIYADAVVPELGWHVYAGVSRSDAFAGAVESLRERAFLGVVVLLLVLTAALVLARRFARPVRALARTTRRVSEGDFSSMVEPSGPSELRELGEAYNQMIVVRKSAETALRKAYRAERRAADELRDIDEMRTAFLRAISHELRTPLTSVVGYSTFLAETMDDLPEDQVRMSITAIVNQSKRLERLLLDLLDVERLERGIVDPSLVETDVTKLVCRIVEQSSGNVRIRTDIKGSVKAEIDPALVERMVENLVFNAIKHTPDGSKIWVRARRANGHLRLSVEDSGDGVPDELKTAIFEPFKQGTVPMHSPGTGVGLNLVAQFAKLHGGRAWVEDRKGGGAVFRIELPAKAGAKNAKPKSSKAKTAKPKAEAAA